MTQFDHFIRDVSALPDYNLRVVMNTGAIVILDFHTMLNIARFEALKDEAVFKSVYTDGDYLLFLRDHFKCVKITGKEFLELALVYRTRDAPDIIAKNTFIRCIRALPDYHLEVIMETGAVINFSFRSRLNTARFGALQEDAVFQSAHTDGKHLIFFRGMVEVVRIDAVEFMDMLLLQGR